MLVIVCVRCGSDDIKAYRVAGIGFNGFHRQTCGALFGPTDKPELALCLKEVM